MHFYTLFGLTLASEFHFPELPLAAPTDCADVVIAEGAIPEFPEPREHGYETRVQDGVFVLWWPGIACYRAMQGRAITIEPASGASAEEIRAILFGTVFGALLQQRGQLPLHASAVVHEGAAVAFCGDSGAGKSTLCTALHRRGFTLLGDDTCVVVPDAAGRPLLYPGFPRVKLWREALSHFAIEETGLSQDLAREEKFHLPVENFRTQPIPLKAIYVLRRSGTAHSTIVPVPAKEQIPLLMIYTYRPGLAKQIMGPVAHFQQCAWLARSVALRRYARPWELARLDDALEPLLADFARVSAQ